MKYKYMDENVLTSLGDEMKFNRFVVLDLKSEIDDIVKKSNKNTDELSFVDLMSKDDIKLTQDIFSGYCMIMNEIIKKLLCNIHIELEKKVSILKGYENNHKLYN